jgi:hypothetical protein
MKAAVALGFIVLVLTACGSGEGQTPETIPSAAPMTRPEPAQATLPAAVESTRAAILDAAQARDLDRLAELVPETGFTYTYGGPVEGGPTAYWQQLDEESPERPLETLAAILELPYTKIEDEYIWPFAYDRDPATLTRREKETLAAAGVATLAQIEQMAEFGHYLGWRASIRSDGTWIFYVAGD